ncbi:MAG TPA: tetratricopeptide repeat protein, partial [Telluria sp.]|nr:tetratricopeptide repeat protein [Telluria sp.]
MKRSLQFAFLAACVAASAQAAVQQSPAVADFNSCAKPEWPKEALRKEQQGTVTLGFLIGPDGAVLNAEVRKSSGYLLLDQAALAGIRRCTFKPARVDGQPSQAWMQMQYMWTLDPPTARAAQPSQALLRAAAQGDVESQWKLGFAYLTGRGAPRDDALAMAWFRKAADQGSAKAENDIGTMYEKGQGVPPSDVEAASWYRKAADHGDRYAQNNLGVFYASGRGVPQDPVQAAALYRKAA